MKVLFKIVGVLDSWKKGDLPGNQMVNITLNEYASLGNGSVLMTALLASDAEVDSAIDYLIEELEIARKKAKDNINKTNRKIRASA